MTDDKFEQLCSKFEAGWRDNRHPVIEDYLRKVGDAQRSELLKELLQIELWWRNKHAATQANEDYRERFSGLEDAVSEALHEYELNTVNEADGPLRIEANREPQGRSDRRPSIPNELKEDRRFDFIDLLGCGGFGAVWRVRDSQLKRDIALKIPHVDRLEGKYRERFVFESQAAARLSHDGIVSVHDVHYVDGDLPVIVSQFVDGESLAELLKKERVFAGREAAALCADLADALQHAHDHDVVHRDLKPGNILIDTSGKAYITDFGLAKDLSSEAEVTMSGDLLGTAAYMAPEQAAGHSTDTDGRCDVYAVGVILYEMVTGERPFRGTVQMLLQQVVHDAPPPPQRLNANVHLDLQTIILRCLEKKPEYRYQSAGELRDDLLRYMNNKAILARPPGVVERFIKWYPSHATAMLGTYFVVAAMTWVFFIAGGLLEPIERDGYQLASLVFLPWAIGWITVGGMILKRGFWFEVINVPILFAFLLLPTWLNDEAQPIALICLIGFFGSMLQVGSFVSRWSMDESDPSIGLTSRLSSSEARVASSMPSAEALRN